MIHLIRIFHLPAGTITCLPTDTWHIKTAYPHNRDIDFLLWDLFLSLHGTNGLPRGNPCHNTTVSADPASAVLHQPDFSDCYHSYDLPYNIPPFPLSDTDQSYLKSLLQIFIHYAEQTLFFPVFFA